jgi:hypothetical protein
MALMRGRPVDQPLKPAQSLEVSNFLTFAHNILHRGATTSHPLKVCEVAMVKNAIAHSTIVATYRALKERPLDEVPGFKLRTLRDMKMTPEQLEAQLRGADSAFVMKEDVNAGKPYLRDKDSLIEGYQNLVASTTASVARLWDGSRNNGQLERGGGEQRRLFESVGRAFDGSERVLLSALVQGLATGEIKAEVPARPEPDEMLVPSFKAPAAHPRPLTGADLFGDLGDVEPR